MKDDIDPSFADISSKEYAKEYWRQWDNRPEKPIKLVPVTESLIEESRKNNAEWEAREKLIEIPFLDEKLNKCSIMFSIPENCQSALLVAKLENIVKVLKSNK